MNLKQVLFHILAPSVKKDIEQNKLDSLLELINLCAIEIIGDKETERIQYEINQNFGYELAHGWTLSKISVDVLNVFGRRVKLLEISNSCFISSEEELKRHLSRSTNYYNSLGVNVEVGPHYTNGDFAGTLSAYFFITLR